MTLELNGIEVGELYRNSIKYRVALSDILFIVQSEKPDIPKIHKIILEAIGQGEALK